MAVDILAIATNVPESSVSLEKSNCKARGKSKRSLDVCPSVWQMVEVRCLLPVYATGQVIDGPANSNLDSVDSPENKRKGAA